MTPPPMGGQPQGQPQPQAYAQQPYGQPYAAPQQPSAAGIYFKKLWHTFVSVMKAPSSQGKAFAAAGDFKIAGGFIAIQAIITMLFGLFSEMRIYSGLDSLGFSAPYAAVIFGTLFFSLLFSAALAGILLGANLLAKNNISFAMAVGTVAVRSIVMIPATLVSLIVMLISPAYGILLFFLAGIWGLIVLVKANPITNVASDDLLTHMISAGVFVYTIITLFLMFKIGISFYIDTDRLSEYATSIGAAFEFLFSNF